MYHIMYGDRQYAEAYLHTRWKPPYKVGEQDYAFKLRQLDNGALLCVRVPPNANTPQEHILRSRGQWVWEHATTKGEG